MNTKATTGKGGIFIDLDFFFSSPFDFDQNIPSPVSVFSFLKQHAYIETPVPLSTIKEWGERK